MTRVLECLQLFFVGLVDFCCCESCGDKCPDYHPLFSDIMSAACSDPATKRRKIVHRSLAGLRKYERTGEQQHQAISNILASSVDIPYVTRMTLAKFSYSVTSSVHSSCIALCCYQKLCSTSIPLLTHIYHCHPYIILSTTYLKPALKIDFSHIIMAFQVVGVYLDKTPGQLGS